MNRRRLLITMAMAAFWALCLVGAEYAQADVIYNISVDTSSLSGDTGFLDFQFNPGDSSAESATAAVTGFTTVGGTLASSSTNTGDASGSLPGTLTFDNLAAYNDVFQGFTFGTSFSFELTLSGQALDSPGGTFGSSFAVSLYDASGTNALLTTDPNGSVSTIFLDASGTTTAQTFPQSATDNSPVVEANAVPEPSSLALFCTLPAGMLLIRRRRWRSKG